MKKREKLARLCLILAIFMGLSVLSGCARKERVTQELEGTALGIDVARYQGTIDWPQVSKSGVEFAMIRVGYRRALNGEIEEDPNGRYNLQEASRAGVKIGVYFFSTAISEEEARQEAKFVADLIAGYPVTYPVAYDCEGFQEPDSRQFLLTKKARTDIALAFLEEIESHGYEGMFYASKTDMENENHWEMSRIEPEYKIWVAQYPAIPFPETPGSSYEGPHQMWQYSMEGNVAGIRAPVDLNVAYFTYDGIEPARGRKVPEEVKPDIEAMMDFEETDELVTAKQETNLRDMPSQDTYSQVLDTLNNGEVAHRIAVSTSGWSKLEYEGKIYYAVSNYLTTDLKYGYDTEISIDAEANSDDIQTQFSPANQRVTAKDAVNLRRLPSVEHEDAQVIAQLKRGDVALCIGVSDNGWSKLEYRGTVCYAISSYLMSADGSTTETAQQESEEQIETQFTPQNYQVTAKDTVNLRRLPSVEHEDAQVITQLKNGDVATCIGISDNGWSKLTYQGQTCYAVTRYLEPVGEAADPDEIQTQFEDCDDKVTAKKEVNLRSLPSVEDPDCVVVASLKNGEVVRRTGINRDVGWSRVEYNGQILYCVSSYLRVVE
ncbi:MAG: hypothetical protein IJB59_07380 [Oscillospiraceae bacterium]|nr:hypothetical protein [Oscillospiraceae bacterium]